MPAQERLSPTEQTLAYVIGLGIALAIIAALLGGLGTIDNEDITNSLLLVGLAIAVLGIAAWLILIRPWERYDDLKTPHYTGHDEVAPEAPTLETDEIDAAALADIPPAETAETVAALDEAVPVAGEPLAEAAPSPAPEPAAVETALPPAPEPAAEVVKPSPVDNLVLIEGIGPKIAGALQAVGITSFSQVAEMTPAALESIVRAQGVRMVGGAHTWPMQARLAAKGELTALEDLRRRIRVGIPQDDLTQIEGIGPQVQTALYAAGIQTYADLANVAPDLLRRVLDEAGLKSVHPETWPEQARLIVNNDLSGLADLQSRL